MVKVFFLFFIHHAIVFDCFFIVAVSFCTGDSVL